MTDAPRDGQGCPICRASRLSTLAPFDRPECKVIHCDACGYEAIRPLPTRAQLEAVYNDFNVTQVTEEDLRFMVDGSTQFLRHFLSNTELRSKATAGLRYLDVGLGNGASMIAAAKLGFQAFGTDIDAAGVARMRETASRYGVSMECTATDIHDYRRDLRFDLVRTSHVIELVLNPRQFVADIAQRQASGGHLIVECHNNDGAFWRVKNLLRKRHGRMNFFNSLKIGELISGFTPRSMEVLLKSAGYTVLRSRDYALRDKLLDPEQRLWYPSVAKGAWLALRHRWPYPFFKSLIPVFDQAASLLAGRGSQLHVWAQKL